MDLDREIIEQLLNFLVKNKQHEDKGIYEAFVWLENFLIFFEEDFKVWSQDEEYYKEQQLRQRENDLNKKRLEIEAKPEEEKTKIMQ